MSHPQLTSFGYSEAAMFLRQTPKANVCAIISIHGQREFGVDAEVRHRLDLSFDDAEVVPANDLIALQRAMSRKRWNEQNGLTEVAPSPSDAEAIIHFARSVRESEGIVLCHCGAGMSRAPAAELICLATWLGAGNKEECFAEIQRLRRGAVPHAGLVRMADELLGRGGRLVNALRVFAAVASVWACWRPVLLVLNGVPFNVAGYRDSWAGRRMPPLGRLPVLLF